MNGQTWFKNNGCNYRFHSSTFNGIGRLRYKTDIKSSLRKQRYLRNYKNRFLLKEKISLFFKKRKEKKKKKSPLDFPNI